jgi:hypothetical protein
MRLPFVALMVLCATSLGAQRPNFSGEWVAADDRTTSVATAGDAAFRRGDMGSGWGSTLTIAQTADSLIVSYVFFSAYDLQPPVRLAFALRGESRQELMIGHATSELRSRIAWRDSVLVVLTTYPGPKELQGAASEVARTLTLASPTSLVVETTRVGGDAGPFTIRTVYTRK